MQKITLSIILFLCLLTGMLQAHNAVNFFEEYIDFSIDQQHFSVNGMYSFCNNTEKPQMQPILFPFSEDVSKIDSIRIDNLSSSNKIPYRCLNKSLAFEFIIQPYDTVEIHIYYRQPISTVNRYIITSTKAWGKSLEKAYYTLTANKEIERGIIDFSYAPDSISNDNGIKTYYWKKYDFMPERDFIVFLYD